jgi:hypothetical protein
MTHLKLILNFGREAYDMLRELFISVCSALFVAAVTYPWSCPRPTNLI